MNDYKSEWIYVTYGEPIPSSVKPNDPVSPDENYTFVYWTLDPNTGEKFNFTEPITRDTFLYAFYVGDSCTVNLYSNQGELYQTMEVEFGEFPNLPTLSDDGNSTFQYWSTAQNGRESVPFTGAVERDIDLYAIWQFDVTIHEGEFTYTNPLWWDWRWNWSIAGPRWGYGWGWYSPWYYGGWYSSYWYGGYWGGWYAGYWGPWHHPHPYWGGAGWHHRPGHTDYRYTRYEGYSGSRRSRMVSGTQSTRGRVVNGSSSGARRYTSGRVVRPGAGGEGVSVRPSGQSSGNRNGVAGNVRPSRGNNSYVRPSSTIDRSGSSYNRPSSTRRTYNQVYNRNVNNSSRTRSYNSNRSSVSSGGSGFNRGSMGGGSTRTRSTGGGGGSRRR